MSNPKQPLTLEQKISEIKDVIDTLRIYIQQDGGDVEFVDFQDDIVTVKLLGACVGCGLVDVTYEQGLQEILRDEVDPNIKVKLLNDPQSIL